MKNVIFVCLAFIVFISCNKTKDKIFKIDTPLKGIDIPSEHICINPSKKQVKTNN